MSIYIFLDERLHEFYEGAAVEISDIKKGLILLLFPQL